MDKIPYVIYKKKTQKNVSDEKLKQLIKDKKTPAEILKYFKGSKIYTYKLTNKEPVFLKSKKRKAQIAYLGYKGYTVKEICEELNENYNRIYMILYKNNLLYTKDKIGCKKNPQKIIIKEIKTLTKKGMGVAEIAKELNKSSSYIYGLINFLEL